MREAVRVVIVVVLANLAVFYRWREIEADGADPLLFIGRARGAPKPRRK